jgi:uncharacterized iron-regulated membrane protein
MKRFRTILFWLHLSAGVFAGIVVLIMSVTGVALMYEKQMLAWADLRNYRTEAPAAGTPRLPVGELLAKVEAERGQVPATLVVRPGPADPIAFAYGREATVYVNPYSGEILGEGSAGMRSFFQFMTDWHRYLGAGGGENREVGKAITGACNLAFLFIVVSGPYLWWPRNWKWSTVKSVILFRAGLSGKARDFNWHNVIGFWSAIPLFFVVISATVISYPWASDLAYRIGGDEPPARPAAGARPPTAAGPRAKAVGAVRKDAGGERGAPEGRTAESNGQQASAAEAVPGASSGAEALASQPQPAGPNLDGVDALLARATQQVPDWRTITLRLPLPEDEPVGFAIDQGSGGQPQLRSTLTLDRRTAAVVNWETFAAGTPGRRLRTWMRFIHTGEALGLPGQTIAGVVSGGAVFLVYTGLALSLRRFLAWVARASAASAGSSKTSRPRQRVVADQVSVGED